MTIEIKIRIKKIKYNNENKDEIKKITIKIIIK